MSTFVYAASSEPLDDAELFRECYERMPLSRQRKCDLFRVREARRNCAAAWRLLEIAVKEAAGRYQPFTDSDILIPEEGKIRFADPSLPYFNLSHSGDRVMCVVSDHKAGCDVEMIPGTADGAKTDAVKLAGRFFAAREKEAVFSREKPEEAAELFCRYWTLKESFLKMLGLGLAVPLDSFEIILPEMLSDVEREIYLRGPNGVPGQPGAAVSDETLRIRVRWLRPDHPDTPETLWFSEYDADGVYRYSCCTAEPPASDLKMVRLDI